MDKADKWLVALAIVVLAGMLYAGDRAVDEVQHPWHLYEKQPYAVQVEAGKRYVGEDWELVGSYRTLAACEAAADKYTYFCGVNENKPQ